MIVSTDGHGLFDASTGEKIARDRDPDPETGTPDGHPDLVCPASVRSRASRYGWPGSSAAACTRPLPAAGASPS
jgi:hypothetical protein